jgi:hypothetical protein
MSKQDPEGLDRSVERQYDTPETNVIAQSITFVHVGDPAESEGGCEKEVWERSVGKKYGKEVWARSMGKKCGQEVWERGVAGIKY